MDRAPCKRTSVTEILTPIEKHISLSERGLSASTVKWYALQASFYLRPDDRPVSQINRRLFKELQGWRNLRRQRLEAYQERWGKGLGPTAMIPTGKSNCATPVSCWGVSAIRSTDGSPELQGRRTEGYVFTATDGVFAHPGDSGGLVIDQHGAIMALLFGSERPWNWKASPIWEVEKANTHHRWRMMLDIAKSPLKSGRPRIRSKAPTILHTGWPKVTRTQTHLTRRATSARGAGYVTPTVELLPDIEAHTGYVAERPGFGASL
ncbi:MAG: hypothetical protein M1826_007196 [Phylliscum demangeonii]|nr:MAG: hypothetical protein M1826_007196 [Phylliscum demangeonii]